jgi:hypothetical protein
MDSLARSHLRRIFPGLLVEIIDVEGRVGYVSVRRSRPPLYWVKRSCWTREEANDVCEVRGGVDTEDGTPELVRDDRAFLSHNGSFSTLFCSYCDSSFSLKGPRQIAHLAGC